MRHAMILLLLTALGGCTGLVLGGSTGGSYESGGSERQPGVMASDTAITSKIRAKYDADAIVSPFNIGVRTYDGRVTLSGTVNSYAARNQALDLAKSTAGVKTVTNQIDVEER